MTDRTHAAAAAASAGPRPRTGAAARSGRTKAAPARRAPRRAAATATSEGPQPASVEEGTRTPEDAAAAHTITVDPVAALLAQLLTQVPDQEVRRRIAGYHPERFADDDTWEAVATLVQLGLAAVKPPSISEMKKVGWILGVHAHVHLAAGTSRSITGWYGHDAVQTTLNSRPKGVSARSIASHASRLDRVTAALAPATIPTKARSAPTTRTARTAPKTWSATSTSLPTTRGRRPGTGWQP